MIPPALTVARLTVWEASRRRLLIALVALTLVVIGLTGWGFSRLWGAGERPLTELEVRLIASQLLILVVFMFSGVLALGAVFVAAPSLAADLESGLLLALLARPLSRTEVVLGKWLGLATLIVLYAGGSGLLELLAVRLATGYVPPHPGMLIGFVAAQGVVLMTMALCLSTRLAGVTGGIIALVAYFASWMGGIAGGAGVALGNQTLAGVGTAARLLVPTDGLWRGAVYAMEPASVLASTQAAGRLAAANPFAVGDPPSFPFLAWAAVWVAAVLALACWSFRSREL